MISLQHGFLFVHIPKTAGNSIQNILSAYSEDKIVCLKPHHDGIERFEVRSERFNIRKHCTLQDYRVQLGKDVFQRLLKFTSVRNPWDRMISFYFSPNRGDVSWDRNDFIGFVKDISPVTDYISLESANPDKSSFETINGFIRFEHLNDDFKQICERIGIPFTQLPQRNASMRQKYTVYYDDELVELVRNIFSEEIMYFGYEFESNV